MTLLISLTVFTLRSHYIITLLTSLTIFTMKPNSSSQTSTLPSVLVTYQISAILCPTGVTTTRPTTKRVCKAQSPCVWGAKLASLALHIFFAFTISCDLVTECLSIQGAINITETFFTTFDRVTAETEGPLPASTAISVFCVLFAHTLAGQSVDIHRL